jgi:hypothetical protein
MDAISEHNTPSLLLSIYLYQSRSTTPKVIAQNNSNSNEETKNDSTASNGNDEGRA